MSRPSGHALAMESIALRVFDRKAEKNLGTFSTAERNSL
jgi:hypothetical protein